MIASTIRCRCVRPAMSGGVVGRKTLPGLSELRCFCINADCPTLTGKLDRWSNPVVITRTKDTTVFIYWLEMPRYSRQSALHRTLDRVSPAEPDTGFPPCRGTR